MTIVQKSEDGGAQGVTDFSFRDATGHSCPPALSMSRLERVFSTPSVPLTTIPEDTTNLAFTAVPVGFSRTHSFDLVSFYAELNKWIQVFHTCSLFKSTTKEPCYLIHASITTTQNSELSLFTHYTYKTPYELFAIDLGTRQTVCIVQL